MVTEIPLGVQLCNPLNIRRTKTIWCGLDEDYTGPYCKFEAPEWGFRAAARILATYEKEGIYTIRGAINRWAPPADNNPTADYIKNVATWSDTDPDQITFLTRLPILKAMARQEQGADYYADSVILLGITLATPEATT